MKTNGDYDKCIFVYHKCTTKQVPAPTTLVYVVTLSDVCCALALLEQMLSQKSFV